MNWRICQTAALAASCLSSTVSFAQREMVTLDGPPKRGFSGAITIGLNASQVDGDGLSGYNLPGLYLGLAALYNLNNEWSIGPEFLYSEKGSRTTLDDEGIRGLPHLKIRNRYIELPVLVHFNPNQGQSRFTITAGVAPAYLLYSYTESGNSEANSRQLWTKMDFGAVVGFEFELLDWLSLMGRYTYSILPNNSNFTDNNFTYFTQGAGVRNNVVSIALRFKLGKAD